MRSDTRLLGLLALAILSASTTGCNETNTVVGQDIPPGAMSYYGFDDRGLPAVQGWIRLDLAIVQAVPQPLDFTGSWSLRAVGRSRDLGPQVGEGDLVGHFTEDAVVVSLNPERADDNVILSGTLTISGGPVIVMRYEGTWTWQTIAGPRSHGTFRAATP